MQEKSVSKELARAKSRKYRQGLGAQEYLDISETIQKKALDSITVNGGMKVHCYESIAENKEVSTKKLIDLIRSYDAVVHSFRKIDSVWVNIDLASGKRVRTTQYDLVIVPMLAGDKQGNRVGYGSGFYDRFLVTQKSAVKIGLCYSELVLENILNKEHDVKLDIVVSE